MPNIQQGGYGSFGTVMQGAYRRLYMNRMRRAQADAEAQQQAMEQEQAMAQQQAEMQKELAEREMKMQERREQREWDLKLAQLKDATDTERAEKEREFQASQKQLDREAKAEADREDNQRRLSQELSDLTHKANMLTLTGERDRARDQLEHEKWLTQEQRLNRAIDVREKDIDADNAMATENLSLRTRIEGRHVNESERDYQLRVQKAMADEQGARSKLRMNNAAAMDKANKVKDPAKRLKYLQGEPIPEHEIWEPKWKYPERMVPTIPEDVTADTVMGNKAVLGWLQLYAPQIVMEGMKRDAAMEEIIAALEKSAETILSDEDSVALAQNVARASIPGWMKAIQDER
ncbi:MAG: hypothetical protein WC683_05735 [bacterium]